MESREGSDFEGRWTRLGVDSVEPDGTFRHTLSMHWVLRAFLVACGLFAVSVATWELHRGVWPLNITSPFFGFILAGAWSVGGAFILAGLFASTITWKVGLRHIAIEFRNPFRTRLVQLAPKDVDHYELREIDHDGSPNTWAVVLVSTDGSRYETRQFGSEAAATEFRKTIETTFTGAPG